MSYTGTKAQTGKGTSLLVGAVVVGEIKTIKLSGRTLNFEEVTNMQSTAEEFISTISSPGEWDVELSRVSSDAGQAALEAARVSEALTAFTVTLPKATGQVTTGDGFAFSAFVKSIDIAMETKKSISISVKLKVSNAVTFTIGA